MNAVRLSSALLAIGSLCCLGAAAQTPPPRFAIGLPSPDGSYTYAAVPDSSSPVHPVSYVFANTLHFLPGNAPHPSLIQLEYAEKGDAVFVTATAVYGDVDPHHPEHASGNPHTLLGTWSGGLNQGVRLDGLTSAGVEPITLKVVSAVSDHPWQPAVSSSAPSLRVDYAPFDRTVSLLTIHNLSDKPVTALRVEVLDGDRLITAQSAFQGESKIVLLPPGGAYAMRLPAPNGVPAEAPLPSSVRLTAAVFADGSYEGDPQSATQLKTIKAGQ